MMGATDLVFAVLAAGALTMALRAIAGMIGSAAGAGPDDRGGE